jgi:hypothetical protein
LETLVVRREAAVAVEVVRGFRVEGAFDFGGVGAGAASGVVLVSLAVFTAGSGCFLFAIVRFLAIEKGPGKTKGSLGSSISEGASTSVRSEGARSRHCRIHSGDIIFDDPTGRER